MLLLRAKAHHMLDAGTVVPTSIEQNQLPSHGEVDDETLEVPSTALAVRGFVECHDARFARA
jgi:hypothetical protein